MTVRPRASKTATSTNSMMIQKTPRPIHLSTDTASAPSSPATQPAMRSSRVVRRSAPRTTADPTNATSQPTTKMARLARTLGTNCVIVSCSCCTSIDIVPSFTGGPRDPARSLHTVRHRTACWSHIPSCPQSLQFDSDNQVSIVSSRELPDSAALVSRKGLCQPPTVSASGTS